MRVEKAISSDLPAIASCHRRAFPATLTSRMGEKYLCKMLSWYLATDHTFLLLVRRDDMVVGYCGGMIVDGTLLHGSASSMAQHTFNEAVVALLMRPWLFFHREFRSRYRLFARNIWTRVRNNFRTKPVRSATARVSPHVGLVVIGIDPNFQGMGYGSLLLKEFEAVSRAFGFNTLSLTVKTNNHQAIKSYQRNGWVITNVNGSSTSMHKYLKNV